MFYGIATQLANGFDFISEHFNRGWRLHKILRFQCVGLTGWAGFTSVRWESHRFPICVIIVGVSFSS